MLKSRDGCGEDMGRKGANGGWLDCAMRQNWNGGLGNWGKRADGNE
ncbi:hypothetical protein [Bartonella sp. CL434QHHD]